jgi:hypothetical protein
VKRALACLAVLALACGGKGGTCTVTTSMPAGYTYCISYTGVNWGPNSVMSDCARSSGTYATDDCMVETGGTCTFNGGTEIETKQAYYPAVVDGGTPFHDICSVAGGFYDAP